MEKEREGEKKENVVYISDVFSVGGGGGETRGERLTRKRLQIQDGPTQTVNKDGELV